MTCDLWVRLLIMISRKSIRCTYRKIYSDPKTESTRFVHVYGMIFVSHDTTPVVCCRRNSRHIWIFTFIPCNYVSKKKIPKTIPILNFQTGLMVEYPPDTVKQEELFRTFPTLQLQFTYYTISKQCFDSWLWSIICLFMKLSQNLNLTRIKTCKTRAEGFFADRRKVSPLSESENGRGVPHQTKGYSLIK